jgi:hypothetical protein
MDEIEQLKQRVTFLEGIINQVFRGDRYLFQKNLDIKDKDIVLSAVRGTKIGTAATQKIAFHGSTPVIQAAAVTAPSGGGSGSTDAIDISGRTAINAIITALKNKGLTA